MHLLMGHGGCMDIGRGTNTRAFEKEAKKMS
jgi:hypothetical protein